MSRSLTLLSNDGHAYAAPTNAKPGPFGRPGANMHAFGDYIRIEEIPDDVPDSEVFRLWPLTINATWLKSGDIEKGRYVFRFAELGQGVMIKE